MNEKEKYLFDLQGYLVVKNVLSQEQLDRLNRAIDAQQASGEPARNLLMWEEQEFRNLIDDPKLEPYMTEILGNEYRLDHEYPIFHKRGAPRLGLHGGGTPYDPGQYYVFRNGKMYSGLTVVSYALTDMGPDDGGFSCIPGSHKSNFPVPGDYRHYEEMGPVIHVPQQAGDVLIFTEALTHGTLPWQADHERRSLLYKYCPAQISWSEHRRPEELYERLTDRQKVVLQPPSSLGYRYFGGKRRSN